MTTEEYDLACAAWHKSTYSQDQSTCVEVARNLSGVVAVRDSKNTAGPALVFSPRRWREFTTSLKA